MNNLVPLFVVVPLGFALLTAILGKFIRDIGKYLLNIGLLFLTILTIYLIVYVPETLIYRVGGFEDVNSVPIAIYMMIDGFTKILLLVISLVGFLVALYSISYTKQYTAEPKFYILFNLMMTGMFGMVISGDIFNMYVYLEIAAIASYALVAFGIEKHQLEASFKYQVLGCVGSMLILMGISFIYWQTGTLNVADIATQLPAAGPYTMFVSVLFIVGFGLKAAMFPFHAWLPDAHSSAPSPISAMLSGVLIKAIGIYVIFRLFFNMFALSPQIAMAITVLGTLSMLVGVLLAIGQWDIKRLLAYHSISQIGYVVLGVGIGMILLANDGNKAVAAFSIMGGLFHLINHSFFKGLLFLNSGAIETATGTRNMKKLGGLSEKMPVTTATTFSASMAISGIPPFNGFFSKLIIIIAAVQAGFYWLAFIAVIVSIITLASFSKVMRFTFYNKKLPERLSKIKETPFAMALSMSIMAILCLAFSLLVIPECREIVFSPAVEALMGTSPTINSLMGY